MEAYRHQRQLLSLTRKCSGKGDPKQKYKIQDIKGAILWCCWSHSTQHHLLWITELHEPWHSSSLVTFLLHIWNLHPNSTQPSQLSLIFFFLCFISAFQHCFPCSSYQDHYIKDWTKMTMFWCSMPHTAEFFNLQSVVSLPCLMLCSWLQAMKNWLIKFNYFIQYY